MYKGKGAMAMYVACGMYEVLFSISKMALCVIIFLCYLEDLYALYYVPLTCSSYSYTQYSCLHHYLSV